MDGAHGSSEGDTAENDNNPTMGSTLEMVEAEVEADFGMPFKEPFIALVSNPPSRAHSRNPSVVSSMGNGASPSSTLPANNYGDGSVSNTALNVPP